MTSIRQKRGGGELRLHARPPRVASLTPFASTSIWSMPIGSGAVYGPSDLAPAEFRKPLGYPEITADPENIGMNVSDPLKGLTTPATAGYPLNNEQVHIPATLTANGSWNNCAAFLGADGRTIFQGQPLVLSAGGDGTMTYSRPPEDLYGSGTGGSHGGSRLSGVGGSIRVGELNSPYPIVHVLKMNFWGMRFLSQANNGYRWPATAADAGYATVGHKSWYGGSNPNMGMGTLLALPPSTDVSWITSRRVKKLAWTLTYFGAYIVDNTSRDVHAFAAEKGAFPETPNLADQQFHLDLMALITMLRVVTNNGPSSIGGGGTPLVSLLSPLEIG